MESIKPHAQKGLEQRSEEAQTSTFNQSKKDVLGGDGQNPWLNIYIYGWHVMRKERWVRLEID